MDGPYLSIDLGHWKRVSGGRESSHGLFTPLMMPHSLQQNERALLTAYPKVSRAIKSLSFTVTPLEYQISVTVSNKLLSVIDVDSIVLQFVFGKEWEPPSTSKSVHERTRFYDVPACIFLISGLHVTIVNTQRRR